MKMIDATRWTKRILIGRLLVLAGALGIISLFLRTEQGWWHQHVNAVASISWACVFAGLLIIYSSGRINPRTLLMLLGAVVAVALLVLISVL